MSRTNIMSRTPLRLSMGGGGTDVESYYAARGSGAWLSGTINKFVQVTVLVNNLGGYIVKHGKKVEIVGRSGEIVHPLYREALGFMRMDEWTHRVYSSPGLEINAFSDAPTHSGLGVSGAITVGLLQILHWLRDSSIPPPQKIAEEAYHVEHDLAKSLNTGWQDQMIAAHGGIVSFEVKKGEKPTYQRLELDRHTLAELESNLILFGTKLEREQTANEALGEVHKKVKSASGKSNLDYLDEILEIGKRQKLALLNGEVREFGRLLHKHWEVKTRYAGPPDPIIAQAYEEAIDIGALGGKVIGASSKGAFMVFYCPYTEKGNLRRTMSKLGMVEIPWAFEFYGSQIVYND